MGAEPQNTDSNGNFETHVRDYSGFVRLLTITAVLSFITAMVVMVLIS